MLTFNNNEPLVYIHLYKAAGSTVQQLFIRTIPEERLKLHYENLNWDTCNDKTLDESKISNLIFYGHFDILNSEEYKFPSRCKQFMTMLRDPFDTMVSAYYYSKFYKRIGYREVSGDFADIETYLLTYSCNYFLSKAFKKEKFTLDNFKEILHKYFIMVGVIENYEKSIKNFSDVLDVNMNEVANKLIAGGIFFNKNTLAKQKTSDEYYIPEFLRELHRELYPLDYAIYDYVKSYYDY